MVAAFAPTFKPFFTRPQFATDWKLAAVTIAGGLAQARAFLTRDEGASSLVGGRLSYLILHYIMHTLLGCLLGCHVAFLL